ncbi:MAG: RIP metalloprotease RseP [Alphaproteobacteria bacterium]|nr:RIP metalloprotease RseP [Alphaproteobacteria bacterium]
MVMISNILYYILPFIILLGILVFVHEFGHFIVARMLGVKVVAFSIGFGKELWSRTDKKGTEWKISAIPLGGYCQFLGDGDASSSTTDKALKKLTKTEKKQAFALQSTWKKIFIVVAGPLFNYLLAVLLFFALFWGYGRVGVLSYVGEVMPNSAAEKAGIQAGDRIVSLNGNPTPDFLTLIKETDMATVDPVAVKIERKGSVKLSAADMSDYLDAGTFGISFAETEINEKSVEQTVAIRVVADSPAHKAGLIDGDILDAVNGVAVTSFDDFTRYITANPEKDYEISYRRQMTYSANLNDSISEEVAGGIKRRMLGVRSSSDYNYAEKLEFANALQAGVKETYDITVMTLRGVWQMLTGRRGGKDIGGIIRIAEMSGDASKQGGLSGFIYFMGLISVNLGLINLFPIPVLDGGNLVIYLIETVIRRELKPEVKDYIFKFGLCVLLAIMVLATWNDISHLISRWFY